MSSPGSDRFVRALLAALTYARWPGETDERTHATTAAPPLAPRRRRPPYGGTRR